MTPARKAALLEGAEPRTRAEKQWLSAYLRRAERRAEQATAQSWRDKWDVIGERLAGDDIAFWPARFYDLDPTLSQPWMLLVWYPGENVVDSKPNAELKRVQRQFVGTRPRADGSQYREGVPTAALGSVLWSARSMELHCDTGIEICPGMRLPYVAGQDRPMLCLGINLFSLPNLEHWKQRSLEAQEKEKAYRANLQRWAMRRHGDAIEDGANGEMVKQHSPSARKAGAKGKGAKKAKGKGRKS